MRLRRLSIATGVAVLAAMALPAHASPIAAGTGKTHVIAACTKSVYKPAHYIFFCADGGAGLNHATYDTWHAKTATGSGVYFFNDCKPSCAGGTIHHQQATFKLHRVIDSKRHGPLFTRIVVSTKNRDHRFQLPTRTISEY